MDNLLDNPLLEERFESMIIPEQGNGVSVLRERKDTQRVSFATLPNGDISSIDARNQLIIHPRQKITSMQFEYLGELFDPDRFPQGAYLGEDLLDGETYLVRWKLRNTEHRLILVNPRSSKDNSLTRLAGQLDYAFEIFGHSWRSWMSRFFRSRKY